MGRKVKDAVDLMKQSREFRFREGLKALEDEDPGTQLKGEQPYCSYCGSVGPEDEGPWHERECPLHTFYVDEEDDSDFPVAEYEEQTKGEDQ